MEQICETCKHYTKDITEHDCIVKREHVDITEYSCEEWEAYNSIN